MKKYQDKIQDFFKWVKGTELVELDDIDVSEDVRPELSLGFRIIHGRKIFGLKYNDEIELSVLHCVEIREMVANQDGQRGEIVVAYRLVKKKRCRQRDNTKVKRVDY